MFTIKQVAGLTGVSEAVLRAWESRYRIVTPNRSANGYRVYDDEQLELLREMAALVGAGVPASHAAATLLAHPRVATRSATEGGVPDRGFLAAVASLDSRALDAVIEAENPEGEFEAFADRWLPERLGELGEGWASGDLGVVAEHFASATLMRVISRVFDAAVPALASGKVLVGLPAGSRHELMLFAFAACLRRLGVDVVYLGADVPAGEWERAASDHRARVAVIGVTSSPGSTEVSQDVIDRLNAITPPLHVWAGGARASEMFGVETLPHAPSEAAGVLYRSLVARGA